MELFEHYTGIIHRYLDGVSEEAELLELLEWLKTNPENVNYFNQVCLVWEQSTGSVTDKIDTELALQHLNQKIEGFNKSQIPLINHTHKISWLRVAAVIIVLLGASALLKNLLIKSGETVPNPDYVVAYAPPSQKSQIILSDGTVVWLNSGTRIKYSTNYGQKTRDIYLEGEAFFKVARNPEKPFLVHASSVVVKALGTSFNVKCYANDKTIETTLIEGKVQVNKVLEGSDANKSVRLEPNEKAVYNKEDKAIKITLFGKPERVLKNRDRKNVDVVYEQKTVQSEISWKEQRLIFENETFEDLAKRLERWYNVNIRINDSKLLKNRYTGKFVNDEPLEQVLRVIEKTTPISYTIDKENVTIDAKK